MKPYLSAGRTLIPAYCGTAALSLENRAAFRAGIASRFAHAMHSWKNPCWGHTGFLTGLSKHALDGMIDVVKGLEHETGYSAILN
jgi:hypothetical protein